MIVAYGLLTDKKELQSGSSALNLDMNKQGPILFWEKKDAVFERKFCRANPRRFKVVKVILTF